MAREDSGCLGLLLVESLEALCEELLLALVILQAVLFLYTMNVALQLARLVLQLEHGLFLVLEQSGEIVGTLLLILMLPLELVPVGAISLQLPAHLDQALALLVSDVMLEHVTEGLSFVSSGFMDIKLILSNTVLLAHFVVLRLKSGLLI